MTKIDAEGQPAIYRATWRGHVCDGWSGGDLELKNFYRKSLLQTEVGR